MILPAYGLYSSMYGFILELQAFFQIGSNEFSKTPWEYVPGQMAILKSEFAINVSIPLKGKITLTLAKYEINIASQ